MPFVWCFRKSHCTPAGRTASRVAALAAILPASLAADGASAACRVGNPGLLDWVCSDTVNNTGNGLSATSTAGNLSVTVKNGSVTGTANGIAASTTLGDSVGVTANGNVFGKTGTGIASTTANGYSQIDIGGAATVTGATGVSVTTLGAYGIFNNNGAIVGTAGPGVALSLGKGTESMNNNGTITGATGTALSVSTGVVTLNNNDGGTLDGAVAGNITTTVNNFGAWKTAGGSTAGNFLSSGSLAFGKTGTGTLTVGGDASFKAGSKTTLNIAADGKSDRILVGGDLAIEGGALALHAIGTGFARGTQYTLLSASGTTTGAFTAITTDLPKYLPVLAAGGGDIAVTLWQYDFRDLAVTRNQYAAAGMVAQAVASPLSAAGTALIVGLNGASDPQVQAGLAQIAGDGLTAAKSLALRQGSQFMGAVADQGAFWRSRESVDPNGITVVPLVPAPVRAGPEWYAGQVIPPPPRAPLPPPDRTVRMWVSGFGGTQTTKGDAVDGSAAQTGSLGGAAVGVDLQLGRNVLLGMAGGYSVGAFSAAERQTSGKNTGLHAAMYTGFTANGFYGAANLGYASYSTATKRELAVAGLPTESESGAYSSSEVRVRMEAGKLFDLGIGSVTAFTAVQAANLTSHAYVETGISSAGAGLLNLAVPRQTTSSVPAEIGFRAETRLRMGAATLAPWLQVSLVHDFSTRRDNLATLAALPGDAQRVVGPRDARDTLRLKGGAQLTFSPRAALFVSAEADLSSRQRVLTGKGGFRYGW